MAATTRAAITDDTKLTFGCQYKAKGRGDDTRTWLLVNTFIPLITLMDSLFSGTESSWRIHFLSAE